jgi:uncharacterized protein YecE (DUF72 family)
MQAGDIRIGISGWTYPPWRGVFFPKGLPHKDELAYAAGIFRSIEVNGTFYALQRPASFARWAEMVPEDFVFSVKAPRFITHIRRLKEVAAPVANFMASGLLRLGAKLGPILWQFPPNFRFDPERMETFLAMLPHDTDQAAALARRHDSTVDGRDWVKTDATRPVRHAVEIRHESFACRAFVEVLRSHDVALVCADTVEWPRLMDVMADFVYCRLHGSEQLYASGYSDSALDDWAERVRSWSEGGTPADAELLAPAAKRMRRDVFVYFDNDVKVRAPFDAQGLMARLNVARPGVPLPQPRKRGMQRA